MREKSFAADADVVFSACQEAVGYLGWKIADIDSDELDLKTHTPFSWKSFTDAVKVRVSTGATGTTVTASSAPRIGLMNWGRDRTNEGVFFEKLAEEIHRETAY